MRTNKKTARPAYDVGKVARVDLNQRTFGGAAAFTVTNAEALERAVLSCLLWEKNAYESGESIADRIAKLVPLASPVVTSNLAIKAREEFNLRHVPLWIVRHMARYESHRSYVAETLARVIKRPDEITEFASLYWKDGKQPLSAAVKRGLAEAFTKFSQYELAKWDRDGDVTLRDVMFLVHPKPAIANRNPQYKYIKPIATQKYKRGSVARHTEGQGRDWSDLIAGNLPTPGTWEVVLSDVNDKRSKREKWEGLLQARQLGYNALLMNLRNMIEEGVNRSLVVDALMKHSGISYILPYQFVSAAKAAPEYASTINDAMMKMLAGKTKLGGLTLIAVDVSGSMGYAMSALGSNTLMSQAAMLAAIIREQCEDAIVIATAGSDSARVARHEVVPAGHGFDLANAITQSATRLGMGGIFVKQLCDHLQSKWPQAYRMILLTDEADCSMRDSESPKNVVPFTKKSYMMNVSTAQPGIGYGPKWTHINGFAVSIVDYILAAEMSTAIKN